MNYMKQDPDDVCQIDAATGEQETRRSVLSRSIRLARSFQKFGLQPGDVLVLGGRNHLDVHIPFYAALMTGLPIAGLNPFLRHNELKRFFKLSEPKIAFCDYAMYEEYRHTVEDLGLGTKIITFGGDMTSMDNFMDTYHDHQPEELFNVRRPVLNVSTAHWISGCYNAIVNPINHVKLQTSATLAADHVIEIINKYKPVGVVASPTFLASILNHRKCCDLTCFYHIRTGASKVHEEFLMELKTRTRKDIIIEHCYGQNETGGIIMSSSCTSDLPAETVGKVDENCAFQAKLVLPATGVEILQPHVTGELLLKGPGMACYYNEPTATKEAFTADGYYKTGDLMYRDEEGFYFYVDRYKMLLKYKQYQISPLEVEKEILKHEGVADVCVTGIPHPDDGERVAACVARRSGAPVTAQEIKDLVAGNNIVYSVMAARYAGAKDYFSDFKRLRGGVLFVDALPLTASGKIARTQVKQLVLTAQME